MRITSTAFENEGAIPQKYTCQGEDVSPPLAIEDIPEGARSLALIVDDPDAPMGTWLHWVMFDVAPAEKIEEGAAPGRQGVNDFGKKEYGGPCPPSGTHGYFFRLFALDAELGLDEGAKRSQVEEAMTGHILEKAELMGKYTKAG